LLEVTPGNGTTNKRGAFRIVANGIRAASGLGFGPDGLPCVSDNQGDWLPANKLICVQEGKFYGAKKSTGVHPGADAYYAPWNNLTETPPTVLAVHNDIANSPTAPLHVPYGPYVGQMLMGDVRWGTGINRYFLEKNAQGNLQGAVFIFTGGLEAGVFRMAFGPDSMLYVGMLGGRNDNDGYPKNLGNGATNVNRVVYGLVKLRYGGGTPAFEMLAVRARPAGFELEFTQPVDTTVAKNVASYTVQSYHMTPSSAYGGGSKQGSTTPTPSEIRISPDRRKVYLGLSDIAPSTPTQQRVVYFRLNGYLSATGAAPWANEAWYTLNGAGTGNPFDPPVALAPPGAVKAMASAMRASRHGRILSLVSDNDGPFEARLFGLDGKRLAAFRGRGAGTHRFTLPQAVERVAIIEIATGGRTRRGLLTTLTAP
jgi:hypothetical protein